MTYQAYLDTIKAKTGKNPEDFRALPGKQYRRGLAISPPRADRTGTRDNGDFIL